MEHLTQLLTSPQAWVAFATLAILEIVLGIDNIVFISILANKLPLETSSQLMQRTSIGSL